MSIFMVLHPIHTQAAVGVDDAGKFPILFNAPQSPDHNSLWSVDMQASS